MQSRRIALFVKPALGVLLLAALAVSLVALTSPAPAPGSAVVSDRSVGPAAAEPSDAGQVVVLVEPFIT